MENKEIHLDLKDMKDNICERCRSENALEWKFSLPDSEDKVYMCKYCGHQETFLENGKRKENPNWSRYC